MDDGPFWWAVVGSGDAATLHVDSVNEHHARAVADWTMFDGKGAEFVIGASHVRFGEDSRPAHMTGFFEPSAKALRPGI